MASKGARLLATFPPGSLAFGHASGWNNLDTVNGRSGLSHSWSTSGSWILPPRLGRPGVLPRHDTICNHHAVRLLLFDPAGLIPHVSPSRLRELLYCTVATGGHGLPNSHLHPSPGGLPTGLHIISHGTRCLDTSPSNSSSRGPSCAGHQILTLMTSTYLLVPLPLTSGTGRSI